MTIATLGIMVESSGVAQANAALDSLAQKGANAEQAMAGVAAAAKAAGGATASWSDQQQQSLQGLLEKLDPAAAKMRQVAEAQTLLNDGLAAGKVTAEQHAAALERLTKGHESLGMAMFNSRMMMQEVERSGRAIIDTLLAGGSVLRAFSMEAARLGEVASMTGGSIGGTLLTALRGTVARFGGMAWSAATNPYVLGGAAIAGAGYETYTLLQRERERQMMDVATGSVIQASGGFSGASTGAYQRLSEELQQYSHMSASQAREVATTIAREPQINGQVFDQFARSAENFGIVTGQPTAKAAGQLADALRDPAKGADELTQKYNMLSAAQDHTIQRLEAEGRVEEARATLMQDVGERVKGAFDRLPEAAKSAEEAGKAWDHFQESLSKATFIRNIADAIDHLSVEAAQLAESIAGAVGHGTTWAGRIIGQGLIAEGHAAHAVFGPVFGGTADEYAGVQLSDQASARIARGDLAGRLPSAPSAAPGIPVPGTDAFNRLVGGIIAQESGGHQSLVSPAGAIGLMQLMPGTARKLGVDPYDETENVRGGAAYLNGLLNQFGSVPDALGAYNWGPDKMQRWIAAGRNPAAMPAETRQYIGKVQGYAGSNTGAEMWQQHGVGAFNGPGSAPLMAGNADDTNTYAGQLDATPHGRDEAADLAQRMQFAAESAARDLARNPNDQAARDTYARAQREAQNAQRRLAAYGGPGDIAELEYRSHAATTFIANPAQRSIAEAQQRAALAARNMEAGQAPGYIGAQVGEAQLQLAGQGFYLTTQAGRQLQQTRALAGAESGGPSAVRAATVAIEASNAAWEHGAENVRGYAAALKGIADAGADKTTQATVYQLRQQAAAEERMAAAAKGGAGAINDQKIANEAIARAGATYTQGTPQFEAARAQYETQLNREDAARASYTFKSDIATEKRQNAIEAGNNDVLRTGSYKDYQVASAVSQYQERYYQQTGNELTPQQTADYTKETEAMLKVRDANQQLIASHEALASAISGVGDAVSGAVKELLSNIGHPHDLRDTATSLAGNLGSIVTKTFVTDPLTKGLQGLAQGKSFSDAFSSAASPLARMLGLGGNGSGLANDGSSPGWYGASEGMGGSGGGDDFGSADVGFANGGVVRNGVPMHYAASGFVAMDPMMFRGSNMNLTIGEQGAEAVMPLRTLSNGRLGVESTGGGRPLTVVQNFSATDVQSFRRSQAQVGADMSAQIARATARR